MRILESIKGRLEQEQILFGKRDLIPIDCFWYKMFYAFNLLEIIENETKDKPKNKTDRLILRREARKNLIINSVTAIEVYFKDMLKVLPDINDEIKKGDGIKELLKNKEKANFWDAWEIFGHRKYRIGDILIYFYSFQNLNEINHVYSKVLGIIDLLETIDSIQVELVDWEIDLFGSKTLILSKDFPTWIQKLNELFHLRHDYTHHIAYKDKIGKSRILDLYFNALAFIKVVDFYIFENYIPEELR